MAPILAARLGGRPGCRATTRVDPARLVEVLAGPEATLPRLAVEGEQA